MRLIGLAVALVLGLMFVPLVVAGDFETEQKLSQKEMQTRIALLRVRLLTLQSATVSGQADFCMITGDMLGSSTTCAYNDLESCERMNNVYRNACKRPIICVGPIDGRCVNYESVQRDMTRRAIEMKHVRGEIQSLEQQLRLKRTSEPTPK